MLNDNKLTMSGIVATASTSEPKEGGENSERRGKIEHREKKTYTAYHEQRAGREAEATAATSAKLQAEAEQAAQAAAAKRAAERDAEAKLRTKQAAEQAAKEKRDAEAQAAAAKREQAEQAAREAEQAAQAAAAQREQAEQAKSEAEARDAEQAKREAAARLEGEEKVRLEGEEKVRREQAAKAAQREKAAQAAAAKLRTEQEAAKREAEQAKLQEEKEKREAAQAAKAKREEEAKAKLQEEKEKREAEQALLLQAAQAAAAQREQAKSEAEARDAEQAKREAAARLEGEEKVRREQAEQARLLQAAQVAAAQAAAAKLRTEQEAAKREAEQAKLQEEKEKREAAQAAKAKREEEAKAKLQEEKEKREAAARLLEAEQASAAKREAEQAAPQETKAEQAKAHALRDGLVYILSNTRRAAYDPRLVIEDTHSLEQALDRYKRMLRIGNERKGRVPELHNNSHEVVGAVLFDADGTCTGVAVPVVANEAHTTRIIGIGPASNSHSHSHYVLITATERQVAIAMGYMPEPEPAHVAQEESQEELQGAHELTGRFLEHMFLDDVRKVEGSSLINAARNFTACLSSIPIEDQTKHVLDAYTRETRESEVDEASNAFQNAKGNTKNHLEMNKLFEAEFRSFIEAEKAEKAEKTIDIGPKTRTTVVPFGYYDESQKTGHQASLLVHEQAEGNGRAIVAIADTGGNGSCVLYYSPRVRYRAIAGSECDRRAWCYERLRYSARNSAVRPQARQLHTGLGRPRVREVAHTQSVRRRGFCGCRRHR
jgi:hypothetical protein